jgi:hypothetical protein
MIKEIMHNLKELEELKRINDHLVGRICGALVSSPWIM